jgi:hypothetical protein
MNQSFPDTTAYEGSKAPANDFRYEHTTDPKVARLFAVTGHLESFPPTDEQVVVITPSGAYNEPHELGRYNSYKIAVKIVQSLSLPEYKIFSLGSGEELIHNYGAECH